MYSISEDELTALMKKWIGSIESKEIGYQIQSHVKPFKKQRVITMCNNPDWAPIEFAKGGDMSQMQGIAIDTLKILEKKLNVLFKTVPTKNWSQSQAFLREGKCEILPAAIATEDRKTYANFTTPYLVYKLAIITKTDKPFVDSLDDIADKKVARKKGSGLISKLKTLYPHMHIIETKEYIDSLKKVSSGEAYCTIATLPVASHFINKYALKNLKIAGYIDMRYRLSIAVNHKDKELLELLNKALEEITQAEQNNIYSKWVDRKLVESFDYRYLLYPSAMLLVLMLLLMYRQKILKGANKNLQKEIKKKVDENFIQYQFIQEQTKFAAMGEMIGVIAHQWRQPLNALGLSVQNLEYHYKDGLVNEDFITTYIDKNVKTIKFMSQTIDDFRGFFKVDKVKEDFSVKESIEATFYMQSLYLEKYNISFVITGDDFYINGFRSEFQQVILNLISNAKDALLEHGGSERGIEVYLEDRIIVFMDNGGGIAEEIMGKVFDSYFTTKEEGVGVGLYMSKIIIEEKMGGKISVYSKGDGTVVLLDFNEDQHEK
jgi:signal transduction histidine kinase